MSFDPRGAFMGLLKQAKGPAQIGYSNMMLRVTFLGVSMC